MIGPYDYSFLPMVFASMERQQSMSDMYDTLLARAKEFLKGPQKGIFFLFRQRLVINYAVAWLHNIILLDKRLFSRRKKGLRVT